LADPMDLPEPETAEHFPPVLAATRPRRPRIAKVAAPSPEPEALTAPAVEAEAATQSYTAPEPAPETPAEPQATAPVPPAAAPAEPQKEDAMATSFDHATDTATNQGQKVYHDMKARSEDAMQRSAKLFEEMGALGKGNMDAVVESTRIYAKGVEAMGREAADYARRSMESATEAARTLSQTRSPTEFFKLQGDYVRTAFDQLVAETSRSTEAMLKLAGEVAQPLSSRMAVMADKARAA
jgi:phasin family protein